MVRVDPVHELPAERSGFGGTNWLEAEAFVPEDGSPTVVRLRPGHRIDGELVDDATGEPIRGRTLHL